ncbi:MAG: DNA/RNA non-specific endonuclease [Spirochaetales bacterium]|uniref:Endonuclease n=1 Tax=Candidatus Thalassospirochaeta sargassi TaxID=3119039 RepID=A0AAJ1IG13_9SPIO|nr:DNA/RNA non-specific endonuclease [Spirochaetales bacterium]
MGPKRNTFILILLLTAPFIFAQSLELPLCDESEITDHHWYKLKYNEYFEQADWAAYELTREELTGAFPRIDSFKVDPSIETGSAELSDYRGSGYDRGHLVPAGDLKISEEAMAASFYLSNMSPQVPQLNRGIWLDLENYVRTWAWDYDSIYVITGPIFTEEVLKTIGRNRVAVPDSFFKAVLVYGDDIKQAIGFIIPNDDELDEIEEYIVNINDIENVTGLDLFYQLPDNIETLLETRVDISKWNWTEFRFTGKVKKVEEAATLPLYWINTSSGTRHNSSCEYYGNTKNGYYTNEKIGKACNRCGG